MRVTGERAGTASIRLPSDWRKACSCCGGDVRPGTRNGEPSARRGTLAPEAVQAYLSVPVLWQVERRSCHCGSVLSGLVRAA